MGIANSINSTVIDGNSLQNTTSVGLTYNALGFKFSNTTLPNANSWVSVAYGSGKFIAIASFSATIAISSSEGYTWTSAATLTGAPQWQKLIYGNGVFVALGYNTNTAAYTLDGGASWTNGIMPSTNTWFAGAHGTGDFVAIAVGTATGAYSYDGINWISTTMPFNDNWYSVTYGLGKFVAIIFGSINAAYSTDGINWTASAMPSSNNWYDIAFGTTKDGVGTFVSVAYNTNAGAYSFDGINWTIVTLPASSTWVRVVYGNQLFIATSSTGQQAAISYDGINWASYVFPAAGFWQGAYGRGNFAYVQASTTSGLTGIYVRSPQSVTSQHDSQILTWWDLYNNVQIPGTVLSIAEQDVPGAIPSYSSNYFSGSVGFNNFVISGTLSSTTQYTKVGSLVYFTIYIHIAGGNVTCTNTVSYIDGLPFLPAFTSNCLSSDNGALAGGVGIILTNGQVYPAGFANKQDVTISGSYITAT